MSEINSIEERLDDLPGLKHHLAHCEPVLGMASAFWREDGWQVGGEGYSLEASGECAGLRYRSDRKPLRSTLQAFINICISIPNSYI